MMGHSRSTDRSILVVILLQLMPLAVVALPGLRTRLWGFDAWTWLPAATLAGILGAAALAIGWLAVGRPGGRIGTAFGAGVALALAVALRDTTHLLGDGRLWLAAVREPAVLHPHEPLAYLASWLAGHGAAPEIRLAWWSHVVGLATLGFLWVLAGRLARGGGTARRWAFAVLATAGAGLFGFGYVEAYPALGLVLVALMVALVDWLDGTGSAPLVGGLFGLAVATHASAVLAGPGVALALIRRRPTTAAFLATLAAAVVPVAAAWLLLPALLPAGNPAETGRHWQELFGGFRFYRWGFGDWCLDQLNRWGFAAGAGLPLLAVGLFRRPRIDDRARLLATLAVGLMLPSLLLDTEGSRGAAADWDAAAVAGWPLAGLAALLWLPPRGGDGAPSPPSPAAWVVPGVALAALLAAAAVAHRPTAAEARFESLIAHTFRTPRARSWGWETLAARRRESNDMAGAARAYEAALAEQPANVRLLRNAAGSLGRIGASRRAADVLKRLVAEVPGDAGAWRHLGMELATVGSVDSARAALRQSIALDPAAVDARNELARSLLATPDTRREARALLARSLELAPGQAHAGELRQVVERLDRDGYGPAGP